MTITNTKIVAHNSFATAGMFIADGYSGTFTLIMWCSKVVHLVCASLPMAQATSRVTQRRVFRGTILV